MRYGCAGPEMWGEAEIASPSYCVSALCRALVECFRARRRTSVAETGGSEH